MPAAFYVGLLVAAILGFGLGWRTGIGTATARSVGQAWALAWPVTTVLLLIGGASIGGAALAGAAFCTVVLVAAPAGASLRQGSLH